MGYRHVTTHPTARIAENATIVGDVRIGAECTVLFNATLRGDCGTYVVVGDKTNVQEGACLHVDTDTPCIVGRGVTIGHGAVVHGCTVGDNTLIGMHATVLNRASVGRDCIIAAGAVVTEGAVIPDGSLAMGVPAKVRRALTPEEIEANRRSARGYVQVGRELAAEGLLFTAGDGVPASANLIATGTE